MTREQSLLSGAAWRKSSYSNQAGGDCVEVADGFPGVVPVRDSKMPNGHRSGAADCGLVGVRE